VSVLLTLFKGFG